METIFLYAFCSLALLGGVATVVMRNAIHSAISLLGSMLCLAGVYALLGAHLLAALQVIIYAGAIVILIVYVIMLLRPGSEDEVRVYRGPWIVAAPVVFVFVLLFGRSLLPLAGAGPTGDVLVAAGEAVTCTDAEPCEGLCADLVDGDGDGETDCADLDCARSADCYGGVKAVGRQLLGPYVLPFEVSSILLLAGIVGTVLLSGRKPDELAAEAPPVAVNPVDPDQPRPGGKVQS